MRCCRDMEGKGPPLQARVRSEPRNAAFRAEAAGLRPFSGHCPKRPFAPPFLSAAAGEAANGRGVAPGARYPAGSGLRPQGPAPAVGWKGTISINTYRLFLVDIFLFKIVRSCDTLVVKAQLRPVPFRTASRFGPGREVQAARPICGMPRFPRSAKFGSVFRSRVWFRRQALRPPAPKPTPAASPPAGRIAATTGQAAFP